MTTTVPLFVNGDGMRGGRVHHTIEAHPFLGVARTAPRYRFFSVREREPKPGSRDEPVQLGQRKMVVDVGVAIERLASVHARHGVAVLLPVLLPVEPELYPGPAALLPAQQPATS